MDISLKDYECDKYICKSVAEVKSMLDKYGVAILPGVLDALECDKMKTGMWDYLETITQKFKIPIKRDKPESWTEFKKLWPKHSMLLQQWSIGHAQFIWDLRQNPKILEIFATIWNVKPEDLLVSFDGASFHLAPETTKTGWLNPDKSWLHSDQCFLRNGFECIQSWVTAYDVDPGDATLTFLEGSHKFHRDFKDFKGQTVDANALFKEAGDW